MPREVDLRTISGRRFKRLCRSFSEEVGGTLSEIDRSLIARAASLTLAAERVSADVVLGNADADTVIRLNSEARRVLGMLRTKATQNKPTAVVSPLEYAARKAAEKAVSVPRGDAA